MDILISAKYFNRKWKMSYWHSVDHLNNERWLPKDKQRIMKLENFDRNKEKGIEILYKIGPHWRWILNNLSTGKENSLCKWNARTIDNVSDVEDLRKIESKCTLLNSKKLIMRKECFGKNDIYRTIWRKYDCPALWR